jgi:DNA-binding transcriptional ArsR family regulator
MARGETDPAVEQRHVWDKSSGSFVAMHGLADESRKVGKTRSGAKQFLKGPVPWAWIVRASQLPGKALVIGLCLWRLKGTTGKSSIPLSNSELRPFGIDRAAKSRGLAALEKAGLITVNRKQGRWPIVTLLAHEGAPPNAKAT